jgi:catalase
MAFVNMPKPLPTSFAKEHFFAVSAFKFTNAEGSVCYGRYRILPEIGAEYLEAADAAAKTPNYLFDELFERIAAGPIKFQGKAIPARSSLRPGIRPAATPT